MKTLPKIGILALQGDSSLHAKALRIIGVEAHFIKTPQQLTDIDGLIIPGGESTTLLKLAEPIGMLSAIKKYAENGGSIFGTCAGAILLAAKVIHPAQTSLGLIDIAVTRNGYGRQVDSIETYGHAKKPLKISLPMTFIRAPRISSTGKKVATLATHDSDPVLVRQGKFMAATFHPELTDDSSVYEYWLNEVIH